MSALNAPCAAPLAGKQHGAALSGCAPCALASVAAEAEAPFPPWAPVTLTSWAFEVETSIMPAIWMLPRESSLRSKNPEDGFRRSRITSL